MGTKYSVDLSPLTSWIEFAQQKKANALALKFLQGDITEDELNKFMVSHPNTFKRAMAAKALQVAQGQTQWAADEQKKLYESMQPQEVTEQVKVNFPQGEPYKGLGQGINTQQAGLLDLLRGGQAQKPIQYLQTPQEMSYPQTKTVYPSDEKIRNIAAMIEALGGNGLNMGKLLTERSQAGYYDAGAAERASRIGINQARQGLLGEQAGLVKLQQQTEMAKPGEIQARIRKIMQDTVNGMFKSEADIRAKLAEVEEPNKRPCSCSR